MPKRYPPEFKRDVVAVARRGDLSVPEVAVDFGIAGLKGSMGRVASAGDNAAMESFFSLLQKNVLNRRRWDSRDELHNAIVFWIEHTYNRRRPTTIPRRTHPRRIRANVHPTT